MAPTLRKRKTPSLSTTPAPRKRACKTKPSPPATKTASATPTAPATVAAPTRDQQVQDPNKFSFIDIAAEIRDQIYDCVFEICPTAFSKTAKHLTSTSGLARVNKQIRAEFLARALTNAPVLTTRVKNFDFAHVVTRINQMDGDELEALQPSDKSTPPQRTLLISLEFEGPNRADVKLLQRWINRLDDWDHSSGPLRKKRGANIKFQYIAKAAHPALFLAPVTKRSHRSYKGPRYREWSLENVLVYAYRRPLQQDQVDEIWDVLMAAHADFEEKNMRLQLDAEDLGRLEKHKQQSQKSWPWDWVGKIE